MRGIYQNDGAWWGIRKEGRAKRTGDKVFHDAFPDLDDSSACHLPYTHAHGTYNISIKDTTENKMPRLTCGSKWEG